MAKLNNIEFLNKFYNKKNNNYNIKKFLNYYNLKINKIINLKCNYDNSIFNYNLSGKITSISKDGKNINFLITEKFLVNTNILITVEPQWFNERL